MALTFNYKDCDDSLLTDEHFSETSEYVIFNTMFVGMPVITRENYSEFVMRIMIWNAALNNNQYDAAEITRRVIPWIGVRTNASSLTTAAFYKKIREVSESTMRSIRMAHKEQVSV